MNFDAWIGRSNEANDILTPGLMRRYLATVGGDRAQQIAPLGIHWCLGLPDADTRDLGEDGHPIKGGFLPPIDLPRRMWASSKVDFKRPLFEGARIRRMSEVKSVQSKEGASGELIFVDVRHDVFADDELAIREVQTIVYREAPRMPMTLSTASIDCHEQGDQSLVPTPQLLFRYSALTFNTHRIHYDEAYAKTVEGYPALVVHGPLMASLMLRRASQVFGAANISKFSFRGLAPAFCGQRLTIGISASENSGASLSIQGPDGGAVMSSSIGLLQKAS
jgi:3-methylfumaryl-CoA hydratase